MPGIPPLKQSLRSGRVTIGSWITLAHPAIAEIMAKSGFDWLAVDLEHSVITIREAEELIRIIGLCGVTPLVRLSANNPVQIKRVMDAGACGVLVPMVKSEAEAEQAVSAVYYPTTGKRGVGLARAQGYGARFKEYKEWLSQQAVVIVLVEHIDAVKNLKAILSVKGVDGYMVGPYDLSASMGMPGEPDHPEVLASLKHVREVAKALGVPGGVHVIRPDPAAIHRKIDEGFTFLAYSLDILMLGETCRQGLAAIKASRSMEGKHS